MRIRSNYKLIRFPCSNLCRHTYTRSAFHFIYFILSTFLLSCCYIFNDLLILFLATQISRYKYCKYLIEDSYYLFIYSNFDNINKFDEIQLVAKDKLICICSFSDNSHCGELLEIPRTTGESKRGANPRSHRKGNFLSNL